MPSLPEAPTVHQALRKSHEARAAVSAIFESLPELSGLMVRTANGMVAPFSSERVGSAISFAMKTVGLQDEAILAETTYRTLLLLESESDEPRVVSSTAISGAISAACLASGLHGVLEAYVCRHLPLASSAKSGMVFDVALPGADVPANTAVQRAAATILAWAKEEHFFATDEDALRFANAFAKLCTAGVIVWDAKTWARLSGLSAEASYSNKSSSVYPSFLISAEFVHALSEGRPGLLLEKIVNAVTNGGATVCFDSVVSRWQLAPYTSHQTGELVGFGAISEVAPSFVVIDLQQLLPNGVFETGVFHGVIETVLLAQDIVLRHLAYSSFVVRKRAEDLRPTAIGLLGVESFLATAQIAANTPEAAQLLASLTSFISGTMHVVSARMAATLGAFCFWELNEKPALRVIGLRRDATAALLGDHPLVLKLREEAHQVWGQALELSMTHGLRQLCNVVLVPEEKQRILADGRRVDGLLLPEMTRVSQVELCSGVQPFVSGKIVSALGAAPSMAELAELLLQAARGGVMTITLLRSSHEMNDAKNVEVVVVPETKLVPMPIVRDHQAVMHAFSIGGVMGSVTVGLGENAQPCTLAITMHKPGSALHALLVVFSEAVSQSLASGVPLAVLAERYTDVGFSPYGETDDVDIPQAASVVDYVFRWLVKRFPAPEVKA